MIGDEVEITIVDVRGDKVRLGITAPKTIPVHRREIYDAIQREKAQKDDGQVQAGSSNEQPEEASRKRPEKSEKASRSPRPQV